MPVEGVFHNLVITKIRKEYAGQGQKVTNAMWGAGQMMFNKILVIADEAASMTNYRELARYIGKNFNPATDVYFSQGPMDVLDHSCSKLGFGGKMSLDGTTKSAEESDDRYAWPLHPKVDPQKLKNQYPEIRSVNTNLLENDIPCLLIGVKKDRPNHIRTLHESIAGHPDLAAVKLILYVEHTVDATDLSTALWRFCNNLDPKRDHTLTDRPNPTDPAKRTAILGLDGTLKTAALDNFQRDWPNIIVANDETIRSVDAKWPELGLGPFLSSPSLKFKDQLYGQEAVASI
jgi:4-hydroxy-3-polyprenylbenzoate decarboxylase